MTFFSPFTENHSLGLPGTIINYAFPSSGELVLGTDFAAVEWFCPICSQESLYCYFHGWFVHLGRMERGRRQSQPWPGAFLVLGTQHSKWSCHNSLLKTSRDENFVELTGIPQRGERRMTGGVPGGCCFLRWMEACPPRVATNTGRSSDPNYSPKEHPQLLESVILLFPPMFLPGRRIGNSSCSRKNVQMMSHSWLSTGQHK